MPPAFALQPQSMPPPEAEPFRCETSHEYESAHIVVIGELDVATVPLLSEEIDALRSAGFRYLILDLSSLDFIDSTGLRLILACDAEARQDGFTIALIPGPPAVERVFELTNTRALLPFIDS
jgi:anti-sigma B factor antagonist